MAFHAGGIEARPNTQEPCVMLMLEDCFTFLLVFSVAGTQGLRALALASVFIFRYRMIIQIIGKVLKHFF